MKLDLLNVGQEPEVKSVRSFNFTFVYEPEVKSIVYFEPEVKRSHGQEPEVKSIDKGEVNNDINNVGQEPEVKQIDRALSKNVLDIFVEIEMGPDELL
ncbi:hypothetical protein OROGR_008536 [Orobanche gracilis]